MKLLIAVCSTAVLSSLAKAATDFNFRRDFFLEDKYYPETWAPKPEEGGRIQFISSAAKNLTLALPLTVDLGGFDLTLDPNYYVYPDNIPTNGLDWCHAEYNPVSGSIFTSLHIHNDELVEKISKLQITDAKGQVLLDDGDVAVSDLNAPDIQVTYVTSKSNFQQLVVHVHNYGDADHTVKSIDVNNGFYTDLTAFELRSGEHAVRVYDVTNLQFKETSVWTIAVEWDENTKVEKKQQQPPSKQPYKDSVLNRCGYGGRISKEIFPIEDWPKSSQCPFPVDGANEDNFNILRDEQHINTHFLGSKCDADVSDVFDAAAQSNGSWYLLPSEDYFLDSPDNVPDSAYPAVAAMFLGDESDSSLENTWGVWDRTLQAQANYPQYIAYVGGHSHKLNGAYAGVTDIQGMDFYVAGCAPHVTSWTSTMRIQGSFDYLSTARQNHKPLTTWLYSQAYCKDCWSVHELETGELLVQLASVVAAGGKGIMLFQSDIELQDTDSWKAGGDFLHSVSLLSNFLRESDPEGAKFTTSVDLTNMAIMQVLVSTDSLLLVVISTNASGYNDKTCALASGRHWEFEEQLIENTTIELPDDFTLRAADVGVSVTDYYELVEVSNGEYHSKPDDVDMWIDGESDSWTWTVKDLKMGIAPTVVRMFMLRPNGNSNY